MPNSEITRLFKTELKENLILRHKYYHNTWIFHYKEGRNCILSELYLNTVNALFTEVNLDRRDQLSNQFVFKIKLINVCKELIIFLSRRSHWTVSLSTGPKSVLFRLSKFLLEALITRIILIYVFERASDCCLTPIQYFVSYIMARTS
jgi:hypothetical protein